jgi:hypothetical protein
MQSQRETIMERDIYKSMIGKRVIVLWTDNARSRGADWIAFRVIDVGPESVWLQGVDAPDGSKHDGSKAAALESEIWDMIEWKEAE